MPLTITADFRFGFYQGRDARGAPERYPSPARLYAAFVSAAYSRALDGGLPSSDFRALQWFEEHAPDAILLPESVMADGVARSYRDKGLVTKGKTRGTVTPKKSPEDATRISALSGPITWWWEEGPDAEILDALAEIAFEVPYLGERIASVRLTVDGVAPRPDGAHERIDDVKLGDPSPTFRVSTAGRHHALQASYEMLGSARPPSESSDLASTSEVERSDEMISSHTRVVAYAPPAPKTPDARWPSGIRIRVRTGPSRGPWHPAPEEHVRWCIVLHRALTRGIGDEAAPLVTGRYASARDVPVDRPANRLAIQIIPPRPGERDEGASFLLMIPRDADPGELERIRTAVRRISTLYRSRSEELIVQRDDDGLLEELDLTRFWEPPAPGTVRWWVPSPTLIGEGGPSRRKDDARWTAADAVRLAVGFVWRDELGAPTGRVAERNAAYLTAVEQRGVRVAGAWRDTGIDPQHFAHRVPEGQPITCICALVQLGDLAGQTQLTAIGQSRHLGGGLLLPVDVPVAALDAGGAPAWMRQVK